MEVSLLTLQSTAKFARQAVWGYHYLIAVMISDAQKTLGLKGGLLELRR
jgi:hypothetical protein